MFFIKADDKIEVCFSPEEYTQDDIYQCVSQQQRPFLFFSFSLR